MNRRRKKERKHVIHLFLFDPSERDPRKGDGTGDRIIEKERFGMYWVGNGDRDAVFLVLESNDAPTVGHRIVHQFSDLNIVGQFRGFCVFIIFRKDHLDEYTHGRRVCVLVNDGNRRSEEDLSGTLCFRFLVLFFICGVAGFPMEKEVVVVAIFFGQGQKEDRTEKEGIEDVERMVVILRRGCGRNGRGKEEEDRAFAL